MGIFIEQGTPFIERFFERIAALSYPKSRLHIVGHMAENSKFQSSVAESFNQTFGHQYFSVSWLEENLDEEIARKKVFGYCLAIEDCKYVFAVDSIAQLDNPETLSHLVKMNRSIIAPLLTIRGKAWSNFWGALDADGFYARSSDYMDIIYYNITFPYLERKVYESNDDKGAKKKVCNVTNAKCQSEVSDTDEEQRHQNDSVRKKHAGFRDRKSIEEDNETVYMTPEDFLRSITPGIKQPDGLDLDSFKRYDPKTGLVWFHNKLLFCLLIIFLEAPRRQFEIAFRMFDINGDGELDINEFEVVRSVIMGTTAMGRRHRDNLTTGCTLKPGSSNSAFKRYFFGPNGDQKLPISKFLQFHSDLQEEIMRLEFFVYFSVIFVNILDDGQLSYREFVGVMRHRLLRGLDKPMDTGFIRLLSAVFHCTKEQINLGISSTYKGV
uniref:Calcium uptake protein 1-like protein, mitochondrial n=1 Tax=Schistosoma haematobium TaxID=6185 RepID=A0A095A392_SCHHA